jgi:putative flippase GtrA
MTNQPDPRKTPSLFTKKQEIRLFLGYLLCGGTATLVDFSLFYGLMQGAGLWYFYANLVSYPCGLLTNFTLNKTLNFRDQNPRVLRQFLVFASVGVSGLLINQCVLTALVESLAFEPLLAKAMALLVTVGWNYTGNRFLTFKVERNL